jgi:hypothetical protein
MHAIVRIQIQGSHSFDDTISVSLRTDAAYDHYGEASLEHLPELAQNAARRALAAAADLEA